MSDYTLVETILDKNSNKTYRVITPQIPFVGFCGYLWQVIRAIYKYPTDKYYIYIGNVSIPNSPNIWDFYFEQPYTKEYPPENEVISTVGIIFDENSEFVDLYPCMKILSPEQRQSRRESFSQIIKNNFILRPEINEKLNTFRQTYFEGKRVLGLHCRGTDHPDKPDISFIFSELDKLHTQYDVIFCTSDEASTVEMLQNRYGSKIITYQSTTRSVQCNFQMERSEHTEHTHAFRYNALINWSRENSGYKIGEDVIMETYLLASTDFLLCGCNSNVNYFIRAINSSLPYKVIYIPQ